MNKTLIGLVSTAALGAALLTAATAAEADSSYGAPGYAENGNWGPAGYPASGNAGPGPYSADNAGQGTGKVVADNGWGPGAGYDNGYADNGDWGQRGYPASGNAGPGPYSADNAGPGTGKVVAVNGWNPVSYGTAYGPDAAPAGSPTAGGVCSMMPRRTPMGVRYVEVCE